MHAVTLVGSKQVPGANRGPATQCVIEIHTVCKRVWSPSGLLSPVAQRDLETWLVCLHHNKDHLVKLHDGESVCGVHCYRPSLSKCTDGVHFGWGGRGRGKGEGAQPSETSFLYWVLPQVWFTRDRSLV